MLGAIPFVTHVPGPEKSNQLNEFDLKTTFDDDELWNTVRSHYQLHPDFINLESGYYNIIPQPTLQHFIEHAQRVNLEGSYYMRRHRFQDKDEITTQLAQFVGCSAEELIITRNTTESLDLVIGGFPWKKGDEAIHAIQDYGAMQDMFAQISDRYGVKNQKSFCS